MAVRRIILCWMLLSILGLSGESRASDEWTVERYSGALSGKTVTVTQKLWMDGALTVEEREGPLRPEMAFALRCLQAELPKQAAMEKGSGYTAALLLPDEKTGEWARENAWRFGLMVTEDAKEERVSLRYVGAVHAAAMRALGVGWTEYLLFLREMGQAELKRNGRAVAWVFCVPEQTAVSFVLPEGAAWEISGDGAGSVIITVRSGC